MNVETIEIATPDGSCPARVFTPSDGGTAWPAVIVFMDGIGWRQALFDLSARLAGLGYLVLLPNLYYRDGDFPPLLPELIFAGDETENKRLMALVNKLDNQKVLSDIRAYLTWLEADKRVTGIGCTGYCMGGRFALTAAGLSERVAAAASFHGGNLASTDPDSAHLWAARGKAKLYIAIAGIDPFFSSEEEGRLAAGLRAGDANYTLETYPGVVHGFVMPDTPIYDVTAAERHWDRLAALLAERLGAPAA